MRTEPSVALESRAAPDDDVPDQGNPKAQDDEESVQGDTVTSEEVAPEQFVHRQEHWQRELLDREPMIDMGVYTKNRCFRLYLCSKFGNDDPSRCETKQQQ